MASQVAPSPADLEYLVAGRCCHPEWDKPYSHKGQYDERANLTERLFQRCKACGLVRQVTR